jgi:hypothetical protein
MAKARATLALVSSKRIHARLRRGKQRMHFESENVNLLYMRAVSKEITTKSNL